MRATWPSLNSDSSCVVSKQVRWNVENRKNDRIRDVDHYPDVSTEPTTRIRQTSKPTRPPPSYLARTRRAIFLQLRTLQEAALAWSFRRLLSVPSSWHMDTYTLAFRKLDQTVASMSRSLSWAMVKPTSHGCVAHPLKISVRLQLINWATEQSVTASKRQAARTTSLNS